MEGQLRNRFKNIRKVPSKVGLAFTKPPPIKKLCLEIKHPATSKIMRTSAEDMPKDTVTYDRHVEYMKKHPIQGNRINVAIKLMNETRSMRFTWIRDTKPQVPAILKQFPYLYNSKIVSNYLNYITEYIHTCRSWRNSSK